MNQKKMRLYLAGPMSGLPDLNFPAFHAKASELRRRGFDVVNPAEINADPSAGWLDCMRADIRELVTCDGIYMLPGWRDSRGATLEHHIAKSLGLTVSYDGQEAEPAAPPRPDPTFFRGLLNSLPIIIAMYFFGLLIVLAGLKLLRAWSA